MIPTSNRLSVYPRTIARADRLPNINKTNPHMAARRKGGTKSRDTTDKANHESASDNPHTTLAAKARGIVSKCAREDTDGNKHDDKMTQIGI